ncbi:hypothetical protein Q1695_003776 [Nippostrongylus brasiliensis]|nr:hypothetical protein Q1695_003776 [Nippostrongylus brasiliensis]
MSSSPPVNDDAATSHGRPARDATHEPAVDEQEQQLHQRPLLPEHLQETLQRIESKVDAISDKVTRIRAYEKYMDHKRRLDAQDSPVVEKQQKTSDVQATLIDLAGRVEKIETRDKSEKTVASNVDSQTGPSKSKNVRPPRTNCTLRAGPHWSADCLSYPSLTAMEARTHEPHV